MRLGCAIRDVLEGLLEIVYCHYCVVCSRSCSEWFCGDCRKKLDYNNPPFCSVCGISFPTGKCPKCEGKDYAFKSSNCAALLSDELSLVLQLFKYQGHKALADPLAEIMSACFDQTRLSGKFDLIAAIPESPGALAHRGFNHAEELAIRLASAVGAQHVPDVLVKIRKTRRQVGLSALERSTNLAGAFKVAKPGTIAGSRVLLVDDVMTTGSTLNEAAKTLKSAGAAEVRAYVLCRRI